MENSKDLKETNINFKFEWQILDWTSNILNIVSNFKQLKLSFGIINHSLKHSNDLVTHTTYQY